MGYGGYSHAAHAALTRAHAALPTQQVFRQTACHALMNPKGVKVRECRDSVDHPNSLGIVFALDVTGSMGGIPKMLATQHLPSFMKLLMDCKVSDPQLMFMAVGDATCDRAALQVGQFESTAELMDRWLTYTFLEGGGGGSCEESYELALYFLAQHTEMDCMVKRGKRGYAFLTGDENPYPELPRHIIESITGDRIDGDLTVEEVVAVVQESYVPIFLIPDEQRRARCERAWRDLLGDHVLCLARPEDVVTVSAGAILLNEGLAPDLAALETAYREAGIATNDAKSALRALAPFAASLSGARPAAAPKPGLLRRLFGAGAR